MMRAVRVSTPAPKAHTQPRLLRQGPCERRRIPARAKKQTYASFDDMIQNSPVPVLVDFYATWCGPCVLMAEVLEVRAILLRKQKEVAPKIKGKMSVVKINTEKYSQLAARYSVQELPTLGVFQDGELVQRISGLQSSEQLMYRLSPYVMDAAEA